MHFWVESPIGPYAALAVALLSCLELFVSLKKEIAILRHRLHESAKPQPTPVPEPAPQAPPEAQLPGPDLNLTARAQALRMAHRGESVPTIAAALRLPRNEVELLVKLSNQAW